MIIISQELVATPEATLLPPGVNPLNRAVFGWQSIVTADNIDATSQETLNPATNLANPATGNFWRSLVATEQYLTVTVGATVDYIAVARHNFGSIGAHVTAQVNTGSGWIDAAPETIMTHDGPLMVIFPSTVVIAIRLRLRNMTAVPQAAVLYVGERLTMPWTLYVDHTPAPMGRDRTIITGWSESGELLGRVISREIRTTDAAFGNLPPAWVRTYLDPFLAAAADTPFFFAWRPHDYPMEVGYMVMTSEPRPVNQRPNGMMQVAFQMAGTA